MEKKELKKQKTNLIDKIIVTSILTILLLANLNFSYGNLEDNEIVDIQKIKEEVIPTVQTQNDTPKINAYMIYYMDLCYVLEMTLPLH